LTLLPVVLQEPAVAVSLVVMAAILVSTVFLPKMHTIAQQSRYRRLKLMTGSSDSTVYTTFRGDSHPAHHHHLPPAGAAAAAPMYYPAYNAAAGILCGDAGHRQQSRSQSRYSGGIPTPSRLLQPTVFLPPLSATNGQAMPSAYGFRFNGLNFLAGGVVPPPVYSSANSAGAPRNHGGVIGGRYDWSREHSPGGGFYHTNSIAVNSNWRKISRISDASSSSKKSKSSEQQLIVSSLQRQAKRCASVAASKSSKKSSLSLQQQQQQQRSLGGSLLLQPSRLDYDENARVYHITP
jgi:hypothetical protein